MYNIKLKDLSFVFPYYQLESINLYDLGGTKMSKGTKAFRITVGVLLTLCILLIACLIHDGATLTATTTKSYAVEGYGAVKLCDDAVLSATSKESDIDIICYGAVTNYGATVNGEMEVLGQLYDKSAE